MKNILTAVFLIVVVFGILVSCKSGADRSANDATKISDEYICTETQSSTEISETFFSQNISSEILYSAIETPVSEKKITENAISVISNENAEYLSVTAVPDDTAYETSTKDKSESVTNAPITEKVPVTTIAYLSSDDMIFTINDTETRAGEDAEALVNSLGSPESVEISKGYFGKKDAKIYNYKAITLYTYQENEIEKICDIEIKDCSFSTSKGLSVGMSVSEAEKIYGNGKRTGDIIFYYSSENEYMYLFVLKDTIISIGYAKEM